MYMLTWKIIKSIPQFVNQLITINNVFFVEYYAWNFFN